MSSTLIKNAQIINEGKIFNADVLIKENIITKIAPQIDVAANTEINAEGKYLIPGIIDDQVHFREPGYTHKAEIYTEAKAAIAGGVTSFMDMPNTKPPALTQELLEQKYQLGAAKSLANYSFFMGTSNDNYEEVMKTNPKTVAAVKIFMGSSTGNMLVDNESTLEKIFANSPMLIATHCEDEQTILDNLEIYKKKYGEDIPFSAHPEIRSVEACYKSSAMAVALAKKHNTRLHIFHLSTDKELDLFTNSIPLSEKRITSEVCVHHLWFDKKDYATLGAKIKCNPAIKEAQHKKALFEALLDDRLDIIATDHAPHTIEEKANTYLKAPSGLPLVQHSLNLMLSFYQEGKISLEKIIEKMCHAPAECFKISKRGYIREGYYADLALLDLNEMWKVSANNVLYKCAWSPLEGMDFKGKITHTWVNGHLAYQNGQFDESKKGERILFER